MTRTALPTILAILFLAIPCFSSSPVHDFEAPEFIALGGQTEGVAAADFNGDGILDLAVVYSYPAPASLAILIGKGARTFKLPVSYSLLSAPTVLAVGDFNNDGSPDIAVGEGNDLQIFLNAGNGTFYLAATYQFYDVTSIAISDFNGDNNLDLVVATSNSNFVSVMLGKGDGTFLSPITYPAGNGANGVAVGDFNSDGKLDLVVSNGYDLEHDQDQFSLLIGDGDGTFQSPVSFATDQIPIAIAAADFNGDGKLDVAVLCSYWNIPVPTGTDVVDIFFGNGDGTFQKNTSYHMDFEASGLAVADLNYDGAPDIAVLNAFGGDVTVLLNQRNGAFAPASYQSYVASLFAGTTSITAGDFSGLGPLDLLAAGGNGIALLHNKGHGAFHAASDYGSGSGTVDIGVGDFTGDGTLDVVTLNTATSGFPSRLIVLPGKPPYHYIKTQLPGNVRQLVVGDFNNDGIPDVVVEDSTTNGEQAGVTVLLGNGDGTFTAKHSYPLSNDCVVGPMAAGDLNGDGNLDLVIANSGCETVTIFLGTGNGDFQRPDSAYTGGSIGGPYQLGLAIADFNNDGKLDIAVSNGRLGFSSSIGILIGKGDGTFNNVYTIADGYANPYAVVAADFNGDGNQDLAVTNYDNSQVMMLLGLGNGEFSEPIYTNLSNPSAVLIAGDFNGDGKLDLAALPQFEYVGTEVAVLHGNGDGTFGTEQDYPTGQNPIALATGDFQGASQGLDLAVLLGWVYDPNGVSVTVYEHTPGQ
jgi:FG-GAP-like repeat